MTNDAVPEVGMGATMVVGSDCYPYTIIEVCSPRQIIVQADQYRRKDKRGPFTEQQEYNYTPNPQAPKQVFTLRKNASWHRLGESMKGCSLFIGHRRAYQDPSF